MARRISRNCCNGFPLGRCFEIAKYNAVKYNENWYVILGAGMTTNAKGRRGWRQYPAIMIKPDGTQVTVEAAPRQPDSTESDS